MLTFRDVNLDKKKREKLAGMAVHKSQLLKVILSVCQLQR